MTDDTDEPSAEETGFDDHDRPAEDRWVRAGEAGQEEQGAGPRESNPVVAWYLAYRHPSRPHTRREARLWSLLVAVVVAFAYWFTQWPLTNWTDANAGLNLFFAQPLIWLAVAGVALFGWLRLEERPRVSRPLIGIAFLAGLMHVTVMIVAGAIGSFADSSITNSFFDDVKSLWHIATLLTGAELARAYLYAVWEKVDRSAAFALTALGFAVVALSAADLTSFEDFDGFTRAAGARWAPVLAVSILATALVRLGGFGPSWAYRFALLGFEWLSPSLPDLDWRAVAAIGVTVPIVAWRLVLGLYARTAEGAESLGVAKKRRKRDHWFLETLLGIAISAAIALVLLGTGVFGVRMVLIEGTSMEPTYQRGDLAIVRDDPDPSSLEVDDVIRFRQGDTSLMHRIIGIEDGPDGLVFTTRGDGTGRPDPPVTADRIEGEVLFHVDEIGHLSLWLRDDDGGPFAGARTYYESLDLDSPVAAARSFADAFGRDDFMTVWLVFDPEAQFSLQQHFNLIEYERLIRTDVIDDVEAELREAWAIDDPDRSIDAWYLFDRVMLIADRHDAFWIDLRGTVTLGEVETGDGSAEVSAEVEGVEGTVTFHLTGSPSGRWRVHQVVVSDGDRELVSWPQLRTEG